MRGEGGAVALDHLLGGRLRPTVTVARQLKETGARWGIALACRAGGQGIALLVENPEAVS